MELVPTYASMLCKWVHIKYPNTWVQGYSETPFDLGKEGIKKEHR